MHHRIAAILAASLLAAPVFARDDDGAAAERAMLLALRHRTAEALAVATPVIAAGDALATRDARRVYSGQTPQQVAATMARAAAAGQAAVDIGPPYGRALFARGFALVELGRLDEAQARYEESLGIEPGSALAAHELEYIRQQRAKTARSIT